MTKRKFNFGEEFLKLFRESIVVQTVATVLLLATCCACVLVPLFRTGEPGTVSPIVAALTGAVMEYWFRTRDARLRARASLPSAQSGSE